MHKKGALEAHRTHFRARKISNCLGACLPPDPSCIIYIMGLTFWICPGPPQSSQQPCMPHTSQCSTDRITSHQHAYTITTLKHRLLDCGTIHTFKAT